MLGLISFDISGAPLASPGYAIQRVADQAWFDFASTGATAQTFTANPTTGAAPLTALTATYFNPLGPISVLVPTTPLVITGALLAQFADGFYTYRLVDLGVTPPALSPYSGSNTVYIQGGTDLVAPSATTLSSGQITTLADNVVTALGGSLIIGGFADGLMCPIDEEAIALEILDNQQTGGGSIRGAINVAASNGAGVETTSSDGTASTLADWNDPNTIRIRSTNSRVLRSTTINTSSF